ncbi:DUF2500 domain-containing protein [Shimwellia pseudoproteus]|uniref:DUF2500 domain-containing protein n=1 Tax=Shimwellia pseudoproteus TaxID=570012 RepID=UPI0018EB4D83|nr:DUF2500 domain-containing protein [Shimwellia pseudoproteus]MBJ3815654.1 DUF2500 domain-containing protein [Shimwellia pseudoproteus]
MNKVPLFFVIIVAIIAVAACSRLIQQRKQAQANDSAPVRHYPAVVVAKRESPVSDRRSHQQMVNPAGSAMRYEVSFRPLSSGSGDGDNLQTYRVNMAQYRHITVGETGTLRVQGTRVVGFSPLVDQ